jgi:hypothetical protein
MQHEDNQPTISISPVTIPSTQDSSTFITTPTNMGSSRNPDINQHHSPTHQFGIQIYKIHYDYVRPSKAMRTDASTSN